VKTDPIYKTLVIGCGSGGVGSGGAHSIAYAHADAYVKHPQTDIVAACDLNQENLARFQETYNVPEGDTDLAKLLRRVKPDLVSVCTFVGSHVPIFDVLKASRPKVILMEKPFALSMDDARRMTEESGRLGIKLAVNHFRRLLPCYAKAREILDSGAIGTLQMISTSVANWDQMEWGTHWLDMIRFFKHDMPVEWVFGQVECSGNIAEKVIKGRPMNYGHITEEHSVNYFAFRDGTRALLDAGKALNGDAVFNFLGTAGALYLLGDGTLLLINAGGAQKIEGGSSLTATPENPAHTLLVAVESLVTWMNGGDVSPIAAESALRSAELCLASYESAVRQKRMDLPLGPQSDFPLNYYKRKPVPTNPQGNPNGHI